MTENKLPTQHRTLLDWLSQSPDHKPMEYGYYFLKRRRKEEPPPRRRDSEELKEAALKVRKSITNDGSNGLVIVNGSNA